MDNVVDLKLFIDNEWRPAASGKTFDVDNPATGEVIGRAALGDGGCHRSIGSSHPGFSGLVQNDRRGALPPFEKSWSDHL